MAEVKWIKITVDMFDDEKIKVIQSMPEGDALLIVWIKLITLAGKTNDGGYVYISENMPYTDEMLSVIMNKPLNTIRLALDTFIKLGMIENDVKGIYLLNFEKHQSLDKLAEIREKNRLRVQKHREKQKQLPCNVTETLCNAIDIDKDKEEDKEIEIDIDKEITFVDKSEMICKRVVEHLNKLTGSNFRSNTKNTIGLIKGRLSEGYTEQDLIMVVDKMCYLWSNPKKGEKDMREYLQPSTLFRPTNFENYYNKPVAERKPTTKDLTIDISDF